LLEDQDADEALLRRNLNQAFDLAMERVQSADNLRGALASSADWDLVISDYSMPSFTALDALEIVREDGRDIPFIIVSGTMPDDTAVRAMREGARDYVMKDNLNRLKPAIERELDAAARRRALRLAEAERDRLVARERELREAAEAAARTKDQFLAVLSHELRTPLTCILGWARMLRREALVPRAVHGIEAIERSGRVLTRVIEDLLDLSAILSGRIELHPRTVDFSRLVRHAVGTIAPGAAGRALTLHLDIADDALVWGDPDRLNQIVFNLLTNSVKFTPNGGQIWISLTCSEAQAALVVRDNGVGIEPDFLPHVFDRFRQADGSVSRAFGGLGLGLSIVRHIVEGHGGTVQATSEGVGRGTTFTVMLPVGGPLSDAPSAARTPAPAAKDLLAGVRVLVVADDPDTREMVTVILQRAGADAAGAGSTDEALRRADEGAPDVVVSDLAMPARDGYALLRALHARGLARSLVTIALTAHARREDRERALGAGYDAYVTKPVEPAALAALVKELVEKRRRSA
jgi:signal transduction histidine kinase